jgi:voltage-gated potassium channel
VFSRLRHFGERRLERAFETGRILPFLVLCIAGLVVVFGIVMWLVDRNDFPTLGLALWWAASTVTTVGYGDVVPTETPGRFVATGLMMFGFASLSLLTGIVASLLVNRRTDAQAHEMIDRVEKRLSEIERLIRSNAD